MANKPIHILRYGTVAEKVHLEKAISAYDYLSINGNSAAYVASAIAKFIVEKFFSKPDKGFFIDPITYAFQNEIKLLRSKSKTTGEEKIKKSVEKLIENYGYPANKVESNQPITVDDFTSPNTMQEFCTRILKFQYNLVYSHIEQNDLEKYFEYAVPGNKSSIPQFRPKFLIAPYFYLDKADSTFAKWLAINTDFIRMARVISNSECDGSKVFAQIVLSKQTLTDVDSVAAIIAAYQNVDCDGITIWVDDLNEHEASFEELSGFVQLLKGLSHKPVYNKVMSVTESISEGSEGILLESVLEGMAEYYSAELSEKVLRGHHENALKCRYNGGTLPIGFLIDKEKNYQIDPITSPYIVEAFTMYDEGRTMKEIVAVLNQHGLKNQRGGELNLNSVSRLLQNRFYIGEYKYREVLVPDGIPAIIPKDLFDRVQEKLAKNKKAPARHKAEDDYLLTTKLFCGDCQSLMFGESGTSQSGATYHYYKCSSAKKKKGCNRKPVKKKWIEDAVLDQVKMVLHDDVFIGDVVHKYLEYQQQENTVIPYLEKSLSDTQRSIDNLIAAIEQGIITPSTKQRLETLEVTKRELEDKILIENMKRPLRTEDELWAWFRYMRNFDLTHLEERRQLIDVFVNTVFLYSDRFLLTLNFGYGSKAVLFTDIPCSDKVACGRPKQTAGHPPGGLF